MPRPQSGYRNFRFLVMDKVEPERISDVRYRGRPIHFQQEGRPWGTEERPPRFALIPLRCTFDQAKFILEFCKFDFYKRRFVEKESEEVFTP
jgi:hypothetical protein